MKQIDITGQRFGRLVAISKRMVKRIKHPGTMSMWLCRCDCGGEKEIILTSLRSGMTRSCGCLQPEVTIERSFKHGHSLQGNFSRTYNSWRAMLERCSNPNNKVYAYYGGQGVQVCARWRLFTNFLADMGERPQGCTLDRYPNSCGNYEPSNCRWATSKLQASNRRPYGTALSA